MRNGCGLMVVHSYHSIRVRKRVKQSLSLSAFPDLGRQKETEVTKVTLKIRGTTLNSPL